MKGIINIGNSCYMNASIQLLFGVNEFRQLCYNNKIGDIIQKYDNSTLFNPTDVKNIVSAKYNMFANCNQQDSYEFLIYLLEILEQLNPIISKLLYDRFGMKINVNIKCKVSSCLHESDHLETELCLHLPITSDLSESYRQSKAIERLDTYKCDKCKRTAIARRKTITTHWPDILIIVLKRFNHMMQKNDRDICIPVQWRHGYVLNGGIIHIGDFGGGHYIYYGREENEWYIANDMNITCIPNIDEFMKSRGAKSYILLYRRYATIDTPPQL